MEENNKTSTQTAQDERRARGKRADKLCRRYAMTTADYDRMLSEQNGCCAICGKEPRSRRLHVDHDHSSRGVRGLLCARCNGGLGMFTDDPELLDKARAYLVRCSRKSE